MDGLLGTIIAAIIVALINVALGYRSQIDAWCERKPRVAGVLKILRGSGFDLWMILQGISLVFRGRLPDSLKAAVKKESLRPPAPEAGP